MSQPTFCFEEFELDVDGCELRRNGRMLRIERIPMELLILLLENPGKLVRREAINERLWRGDVFVETEHSINTAINKLRAVLRDDPRDPRFIRTVVGRGYCFIAKVSVMHPVEVASPTGQRAAEIVEPGIPKHSPAGNGNGAHPSQVGETREPADETAGGVLEISSPFDSHATSVVTSPHSDRAAGEAEAQPRRIARAIVLGCVLVGIVLAGYLVTRRNRQAPRTPAVQGVQSIAVLPFRNLTQDVNQDYLVDGMTDQLIADLGRSTSLRVISYGSVMQYKGVQRPFKEIARELNVDVIVEGSYAHTGQRGSVTVQLLDARDNRQVWAQSYEESGTSAVSNQDQVIRDIAHRIALSLSSRLTSPKIQAVSPEARDAYLRGRYLWNQRTFHSLTESIGYYKAALRADPDYAEAYAAMAESYVLLSIGGGLHPSDSLWKAQFAAERALQLDESLGQAHTALAAVKTDRDWDWMGADREYRRALELSPDDPTTHHWYSLHLSRLGRFPEAEAEIQRALALDPLSLIINTDAAETAYWARKPDEALKRAESVLALNPDFAQAHESKGKALEQLHRYREAEQEFDEAGRLFGGPQKVECLRAHAQALAGSAEPALVTVRELEARSKNEYVSGIPIALVYCALRRPDEAMKWLSRARQEHDTGINMLKVEPLFDGCRTDARFQRLVEDLDFNTK